MGTKRMTYCPATGHDDCEAGDMRCVAGECWRLREQRKAELAARGIADEGEPMRQSEEAWLETTRASQAERAAAAREGKGVCPSCGDWLPLDLHEFTCLGKGHHVAVQRDSVLPSKPPPTAADILAKNDADFQRAMRNVVATLVGVALVFLLALFIGWLSNRHEREVPTPPPARTGAS